jgi:transcription elongation factor GreB
MSRAFVKEGDGEDEPLPERPLPAHANYVTARGLAQLQARVRELAGECETLRRIAADDSGARQKQHAAERDLRYFNAQLERAELVTPAARDNEIRDEIHFGATVRYIADDGIEQQVRIVGDDEADAAAGAISWASPLARALIGARMGEVVTWRRPAGAAEIEILGVTYAPGA